MRVFKKLFMFNLQPSISDFRERGRRGEKSVGEREKDRERGRERNTDVREKCPSAASCMCPNWCLNPQPFGVWDDSPNNSATWPGQYKGFYFLHCTLKAKLLS